MEPQYLAFRMRSSVVAILLAAFITMSTQQGDTTTTINPNTTTEVTNATTTIPPSNNTATATTPVTPTSKPTTVTTPKSTEPPPLGKLRPVGDACLQQYFSCVDKSTDYLAANFCKAFSTSKTCINGTNTNCSNVEVSRIEYVDCGPNKLGTENTVGTFCQGRITECLSLSDKPDNINPDKDFKTFFCEKRNENCLITASTTSKAVCKAEEYKAAVKVAGCTAAETVISSGLFVSLAVLTQRILYRY